MRWPPWASDSQAQHQNAKRPSERDEQQAAARSTSTPKKKDWQSSVSAIDWAAFTEARTIIPTLILTSGFLGAFYIHRRYLRRFPDAVSITPSYFRRRSLLGQVTSVGDGDNFRIYHTPGGRLAGWGWLPWKKIPTSKKELRDKTVRLTSVLCLVAKEGCELSLIRNSGPHSSSWHRRPRARTLRPSRTAFRPRSTPMAYLVSTQPSSPRLHPSCGPVSACGSQCVRAPGAGLSTPSSSGRVVRDAETGACDCVRSEIGCGVRRRGHGAQV
jgi:hypothetical protein